MQPRRVTVTLELETDMALKYLASRSFWAGIIKSSLEPAKVVQAQANVIQQPKPRDA